ncbi:MAG: hypothetical protein IJU60_05545 [Acholeplasmatales bacterium]|nr:hypothetical protein [Acholeplasmatales bacterium]
MASKNRKRKNKFVWTKELIFLIAGLLILIAIAVVINLPTSAEKSLSRYNTAITTYNTDNSTSYTTLPKDHVFKEIDYNGLLNEKTKNEYVYVFYGSLTSGTYLEQLSNINTKAKDCEVKTVYLMFADWYENATDKESLSFITELEDREEKLSSGRTEHDKVSLAAHPALLVFKDNKLVYNTQTYQNATSGDDYNWNMYINKALTLSVESK